MGTPKPVLPPAVSQPANSKLDTPRTIGIAGGKGGVGRSNVAINVTLELAEAGWRVTLLDADLALANAHVLLLSAELTLEEVIITTENRVRLIPGGTGIEEIANLSQAQQRRLIAELTPMEAESDFMIIDTAAGVGHNVTSVHAATDVVIVTPPDPTAVVDTTIKVVHRYSPTKPIWIVVNDVVAICDADQVFGQIRSAAKRFLNRPVVHIGSIPRDAELAEPVRQQIPVVDYSPETPASRSLRLIARHWDQAHRHSASSASPAQSFWQLLSEPED